MTQLIQFVVHNWSLLLALLIIIVLLILEERKGSFSLKGLKQITPQELVNLINHESAKVIDIRPVESFQDGHITGAFNLPMAELETKINTLLPYKDQPVVMVCPTGRAAVTAGLALQKQGFVKIYILAGGINAWQKSGLPLVKK